MSQFYVFKLRTLGDSRPWESIPPHDRRVMTPKQAKKQAQHIAIDPAVVEVRYNAAGSLQGHYVPGTAEAQAAHRASAEAAAMRGLALHEVF